MKTNAEKISNRNKTATLQIACVLRRVLQSIFGLGRTGGDVANKLESASRSEGGGVAVRPLPNTIHSRFVPAGFGGGREEGHGALGEGGDGEAGVYAEVGADDGAVADVHIFVAEDAVAMVHDAARGRIGDAAAS